MPLNTYAGVALLGGLVDVLVIGPIWRIRFALSSVKLRSYASNLPRNDRALGYEITPVLAVRVGMFAKADPNKETAAPLQLRSAGRVL